MGIRKADNKAHVRRPGRKVRLPSEVPIELYDHKGKQRPNNPPVGLVDHETDPYQPPKKYLYDPHLDPLLQWAGKAERTSFDVPTVSLHVHERIDTRTIIETVRKTNAVDYEQISLFSKYDRRPITEEIEFYKHPKNWVNRLIAGDSLLVMNSLLEKESMGSRVQMIYFDPPYGIKYGSNFQPFVNKRDVKDGNDADLNSEPEMLKAFRDTWELGIHSYLTYLRDRLLLAKDLLDETGSVFVQIGDENVHRVRCVLDEVFGAQNCISVITVKKTAGLGTQGIANVADFVLWYGKNAEKTKKRTLYTKQDFKDDPNYVWIMNSKGEKRRLTQEERESGKIPEGWKLFRHQIFLAAGRTPSCVYPIKYKGESFNPTAGRSWSTNPQGAETLIKMNRVTKNGNTLNYVRFSDDFPYTPLSNFWEDGASGVGMQKVYVVQTNTKIVQRCLLMTTDPGDLVLDITCGSGTTAHVAEEWGRRWITCDTSRIAVTLAKQRLMTASFDYYNLAHPTEGVGSGFAYKVAKRVTLASLANGEPAEGITLYDQPEISRKRIRVSGPFTVEAVPAPVVRPLSDDKLSDEIPNASIIRSGETSRQREWRDELFRTGIRAKNKLMIEFSRLELLSGTRFIHAEGETKSDSTRVVVSFGPAHAPLEQRQVELAISEAQTLVPKPKVIVFASFQFDPEAAKDIDELNWPGVQILKVQMNPDLFTSDLKKKRSSNESFWLMGQPDIDVRKIPNGDYKGMFKVEVHGFDYFNPVNGAIESGGTKNIAMWMLDTDYDGRSMVPRQVFFPMGAGDGWEKLAKTLRTEIDEDLIEAYRGTVSLPFEAGANKQIAVKIVDDRGIESLRIIKLDNDN